MERELDVFRNLFTHVLLGSAKIQVLVHYLYKMYMQENIRGVGDNLAPTQHE